MKLVDGVMMPSAHKVTTLVHRRVVAPRMAASQKADAEYVKARHAVRAIRRNGAEDADALLRAEADESDAAAAAAAAGERMFAAIRVADAVRDLCKN